MTMNRRGLLGLFGAGAAVSVTPVGSRLNSRQSRLSSRTLMRAADGRLGDVHLFRDPAEIAKYLKANSVETVMGPLSWDAKGDLKGFEFGVFDWHANGTATDAK